LFFTNEYKMSSRGALIDQQTVEATDWPLSKSNNSPLLGRLAAGGSLILWANGTYWEAHAQ
jgi:hypothetical protein